MKQVIYNIPNGINGLFYLPTEVALRLLPDHVQPIEAMHGRSVVGITLFEFSGSNITLAPYVELVVSLYVVPKLGIMKDHPHAAVFPLSVASSNQQARNHAIDLWHLPHYMEDISLDFEETAKSDRISGLISCTKGEPIVQLSVNKGSEWQPMFQAYQSFQQDETGRYIGILDMQGSMTEHEEGTGNLQINLKHRFFKDLDLSEMDTTPMREMWLKNGQETYHKLVTLEGELVYG